MKFEKVEIGMEVKVFDRYLFAMPLKAVVSKKSQANDGVCVILKESNNTKFPIGCDFWAHAQQLKKLK